MFALESPTYPEQAFPNNLCVSTNYSREFILSRTANFTQSFQRFLSAGLSSSTGGLQKAWTFISSRRTSCHPLTAQSYPNTLIFLCCLLSHKNKNKTSLWHLSLAHIFLFLALPRTSHLKHHIITRISSGRSPLLSLNVGLLVTVVILQLFYAFISSGCGQECQIKACPVNVNVVKWWDTRPREERKILLIRAKYFFLSLPVGTLPFHWGEGASALFISGSSWWASGVLSSRPALTNRACSQREKLTLENMKFLFGISGFVLIRSIFHLKKVL